MTDSGSGAFEVCEVVKAVVGEKRYETYLHPILIGHAVPYLVELAYGENAEEVKASLPSTGSEWMESFNEAWKSGTEKVMPGLILGRAKTWSGISVIGAGTPPPPLINVAAPGSGAGFSGGAGAGVTTSTGTSGAGAYNDMTLAHMLKDLVVSDHDTQKAISDINAQRITGLRMMGLGLALVSGFVHPAGESAELRYGSDMRLCSVIRQQRKAGVATLDDIIKNKSRRELALHYSRLAKEYNDRHMIEEATLVSQFWAETGAAFEGDDTGLFVYLSEWMRTYAGRGIPKLLDTDLILRHRKEAGGASSSDLKKLEEAIKGLQSKLNTADSKSAELAKRVTRAESKTHGGPSDLKGKSCFICGGDHLAKDCTQKKGHKGKGGKETEVIDVTDDE